VELDGTGKLIAAYIHGPGIDEPVAMMRDENRNGTIEQDEVFVFTRNHLGSIQELTGLDGKLKQRYRYSAFGETKIEKDDGGRITHIENPFAYTGREWTAETGCYYYRARWYCPEQGRFISRDLIGLLGGDTNLFRYVGNNPLSYSDPFGLVGKEVVKAGLKTAARITVNIVIGLSVAAGLIGSENLKKIPSMIDEVKNGFNDIINDLFPEVGANSDEIPGRPDTKVVNNKTYVNRRPASFHKIKTPSPANNKKGVTTYAKRACGQTYSY